VSRTVVETVSGRAALAALAEAGWDRLLEDSGRRDATRRMAALARPDPFSSPRRARAITVRRDGRVVAAAALTLRREGGLVVVRHHGPMPFAFDLEPPARDDAARDALAGALLDQGGDVLALEELPPEGGIAAALRRREPRVALLDAGNAYTVDLRRPPASLRRRRRQAAQHARRAEAGGLPLTARYRSAWHEIEPRLDEALDLLRRSWTGRAADRYTGTAEGRRAMRELVHALGAEGRVRLAEVRADEQLAAFHIAFAWAPGAVLFKTAFDRRLPGLPGLGWRSLLTALDGLAEEGIAWAGLGSGGDEYKRHAAAPHPLVTVRAPLSPGGAAYLGLARAHRRLRARLRPRTGAP
jgi:uncharacterized protein YukE